MKRLVLIFLIGGGAIHQGAAQPTNDDVANAVEIHAGTVVAGTTLEATAEATDIGPISGMATPLEPRSVWYRWYGTAGYASLRLTTDSTVQPYSSASARVAVREGGSVRLIGVGAFPTFAASSISVEARFLAETGREYLIMISSYGEGKDFSLHIGPMMQPRAAHDDLEQAGVLPVMGGPVDMTGATLEPGEPSAENTASYGESYQATAWMHWTAPAAGYYSVSGSATAWYPWVVQAFRGSTFPLASAVLGRSGTFALPVDASSASRITFKADAGETLLLRVASSADQVVTLSIGAAPPGDHFAAPLDAGNAPDWTIPLPHSELTAEFAEPSSGPGTLWVNWTAPDNAVYEISSRLSNSESGWLSYRPLVKAYQGNGLETLAEVPSYASLGFDGGSKQFRATAGSVYRFQASVSFSLYDYVISNEVGVALNSSWTIPTADVSLRRIGYPPPNDDFANADDLGSGPATGSGTNAAATPEAAENLPFYSSGDTVWHKWTAPADGGKWELLVVCPSRLEVVRFRGNSLAALIRDETKSFYREQLGKKVLRMRWAAAPGQVYHFRLNSLRGAMQGPYELTLRRLQSPPNDDPGAAILLSGPFPMSVSGAIAEALDEPADSNPGWYGDRWGTVWWRWFAPSDGWVKATASDAAVAVTENGVAMGYSAMFGADSVIRFRAWAGRTYLIRLAQDPEVGRPVTLTLESAAGFAHATPDLAIDLGSAARITAAPQLLSPGPAFSGNTTIYPSLWHRWTAPHSGWFSFDSEGSVLRPVHLQLLINAGSEQVARNEFYPDYLGQVTPALVDASVSVSRLLHRVEVGQTVWIAATTDLRAEGLAGEVRVNIQPAGPPPTLDAVEIRPLPASPDKPRMVEVLVSATAPNGLSSGLLTWPWNGEIGLPVTGPAATFDDSARLSGDAFSGTYRLVREVPSRLDVSPLQLSQVTIADRLGGQVRLSSPIPMPALAALTSDAEPPVLESVAGVSGGLVLTDSLQEITLQMVISDRGGSGFTEGDIFFASSLFVSGVNRRWPVVHFSGAQRIRGDALDGTYQVTLTLPSHLPSGSSLHYSLRDAAGNRPWWQLPISGREWWIGGTVSVPFPVPQEFTGSPDETPPAVTDLSISGPTASPLSPFGTLTATFRISDDLSGFDGGSVVLLDANGVRETAIPLTAQHRLAGNAADGFYQISAPLPQRGFGGRHSLELTVMDASGMSTKVVGATADLPDRTTADQRPPRLTYFQISPATVDLRSAPANVHVSLGANDDQPGISGIVEIRDNSGKILAAEPLRCASSLLACDFNLTLPARSYLGAGLTAEITVVLTDASGRSQTYGLTESPAWPAAVALQIQPAAPDFLTQWAAEFPGYVPATHDFLRDSDGDGTADLVEFALGTDPTVRSVLSEEILLSTISNVQTTRLYAGGIDPRSHRLPHFHRGWSGWVLSLNPEPVAEFSFLPSPRTTLPAWTTGPWRLLAERSSDLITWTTANRSGSDSFGREVFQESAAVSSLWYRLRLERRP